MRSILLSLFFIFSISSVFSQILTEENFDSFTPNDKIAEVAGSPWTTWSNAPGGAEDGTISSDFASSAPNSLHIVNNNDVVYSLGDKSEGRYKIEFNLLIKSGKIGYFNILQEFSGADSKWGPQIFFNPGGQGKIDAGKSDAASFTYNYEEWIPIIIIVDLDIDFATFYLNNDELVSWKWSTGSFGSNNLNRLDAINFYGTTTGGTSSMYIDDITISSIETPAAPLNLIATISDNKDVSLTWEEPATKPDSYMLMKDGLIFQNEITETNFEDTNIYPGEATYTVRSRFGDLGMSAESNESTVIRTGGVDRSLVLFEVGTGTGCPKCPSAARGVDALVSNGKDVAILEYHNYNPSDPFNNADATVRAGYYDISGYPTQFHDGTIGVLGGSYTGTLYPSYLSFYTTRKPRPSLYTLDMSVVTVSETDYIAHITVEENSDYYAGLNKTLRVAVNESDIDFDWQNLHEIHFTERKMFPDAHGIVIDFSSDSNQTLDIEFSIDPLWVKDNCELIVFLQSDDTKEVLQTIKFDMENANVGVEDINDIDVDIFPNPANSFLFTDINQPFTYTIYSINGQIMKKGNSSSNIDIRFLNSGMYVLNLATNKGTIQKKFIKE